MKHEKNLNHFAIGKVLVVLALGAIFNFAHASGSNGIDENRVTVTQPTSSFKVMKVSDSIRHETVQSVCEYTGYRTQVRIVKNCSGSNHSSNRGSKKGLGDYLLIGGGAAGGAFLGGKVSGGRGHR